MKERPILFTKENRQKCIAGLKTQTRRIVKFPDGCDEFSYNAEKGIIAFGNNDFTEGLLQLEDAEHCRKAPYAVGDLLYQQEPYQIRFADDYYITGCYLDNKNPFDVILTSDEWELFTNRKKPNMKTSARFMYKSLARYWYEVTGVRVEQNDKGVWEWVVEFKRIERTK